MLDILENTQKSRICQKLQKLLEIPENARNGRKCEIMLKIPENVRHSRKCQKILEIQENAKNMLENLESARISKKKCQKFQRMPENL